MDLQPWLVNTMVFHSEIRTDKAKLPVFWDIIAETGLFYVYVNKRHQKLKNG